MFIFFLFNSVVDAWGKIPSGILERNIFELGAFSECFRIERGQMHYGTKYCLAQLKLNLNDSSVSQSYYDLQNHFFANVLQFDEKNVPPSLFMPQQVYSILK